MKDFIDYLENNKDYLKALNFAKDNSKGKIWLIGGAVYKSLAKLMHSKKPAVPKDYDFIVEEVAMSENNQEWIVTKNGSGNPKFKNGKIAGDLVPLNSLDFLMRIGLETNMKNFLETSPLDVTAIAYDTKEKKLIGKTGLSALKKGKIKVLNKEHMDAWAKAKNRGSPELIKKLAEEIEFRY
ncbi:MAG: hypothetical protein PVJ67_06355 [Candidatus Pacearchaeota archaeon]|jgi:hypothetical protein